MSGYTSVTTFVRGENAQVEIYRDENGNWFMLEVRDGEGNRFGVSFHFENAVERDTMVKSLGVAAIRA